ncbi:MAG: 4-(cytidine 5'-diphospho)-2-C-methyl-D-erythritol kinase [Candidatus Binataceae bacterium]
MVKLLAEHAPAKINLCLRITGKRADGYHELDSIFLPIAWTDTVRVEARPSDDARVTLRCDNAALADADSNLASLAAIAFMREYAITAQILVGLEKRIPMGAGLGGGSSDAGAVLRMMAAIFAAPNDARLAAVAVGLGADVPFFLDPRPARVRGIGEIIQPLANMSSLNIVVAVPQAEVPTAKVFRALGRENWSGPLADADLAAIVAGQISSAQMVNDLAAPAIDLFPEIARLKVLLEEEGAQAAAMSGSGGAVFGIYPDAPTAASAAEQIRARGVAARVEATYTTDLAALRKLPLAVQ